IIRAVNGVPVEAFQDLQSVIAASAGQSVTVAVERSGQPVSFDVVPRAVEIETITGETQTIGRLGITNAVVSAGPLEAVAGGVGQTWYIIKATLGYLGQLVVGAAAPDQLSGPIGIAKISGDVAALGFLALLNLTALLSVSIGLI